MTDTNKLHELHEEYKHSKRMYLEKRQELFDAEDELEEKRQVRKLVQEIAQEVQKQAHVKICGLVTKCLRSVFGNKYEFEIEFVQKRNKTEAEMKLVKGGIHEFHPLDGSGAVKDIVSFACRLISICMSKPIRRRVVILDEPFKWIQKERRELVCELLETLAEELKIQFIMTTHIEELKIGNIIDI